MPVLVIRPSFIQVIVLDFVLLGVEWLTLVATLLGVFILRVSVVLKFVHLNLIFLQLLVNLMLDIILVFRLRVLLLDISSVFLHALVHIDLQLPILLIRHREQVEFKFLLSWLPVNFGLDDRHDALLLIHSQVVINVLKHFLPLHLVLKVVRLGVAVIV